MDWLVPLRAVDEAGEAFEVLPHSATLGTYGSFLMACAVRAASATVEGMGLTTLRADFLTPPPEGPIRFDVESTRTGRSVAVRRVVVGEGTVHAVIALSFVAPGLDAPGWEPEPTHFGDVPESLDRFPETSAGLSLLDIRPVQTEGPGYERRHPFWARPAEPFGDSRVAAAAAVVLATDHFVTALATPIEDGQPSPSVTLDHSVWLHRLTHADEWLRYDAGLVASTAGSAVIRGTVADSRGRLVASFVQQAMRRDRGRPTRRS